VDIFRSLVEDNRRGGRVWLRWVFEECGEGAVEECGRGVERV
jgi:hypothetical protein